MTTKKESKNILQSIQKPLFVLLFSYLIWFMINQNDYQKKQINVTLKFPDASSDVTFLINGQSEPKIDINIEAKRHTLTMLNNAGQISVNVPTRSRTGIWELKITHQDLIFEKDIDSKLLNDGIRELSHHKIKVKLVHKKTDAVRMIYQKDDLSPISGYAFVGTNPTDIKLKIKGEINDVNIHKRIGVLLKLNGLFIMKEELQQKAGYFSDLGLYTYQLSKQKINSLIDLPSTLQIQKNKGLELLFVHFPKPIKITTRIPVHIHSSDDDVRNDIIAKAADISSTDYEYINNQLYYVKDVYLKNTNQAFLEVIQKQLILYIYEDADDNRHESIKVLDKISAKAEYLLKVKADFPTAASTESPTSLHNLVWNYMYQHFKIVDQNGRAIKPQLAMIDVTH
jgi:hypothetical protein